MKKILKITVIALFIVCICSITVFAEEDLTSNMNINVMGKNTGIVGKFFGMVLGVVQIIGAIVTVVSIVIGGIKYMISSINEKATIKQQAIPFVIGGVIIFSASSIIKLIANFVSQNIN